MIGNGYFGEWITDEQGLPAYNYKCNQLIDPKAKTKTTYGFSTDHFHQLGNDRIIGTAHNGGYVQLLDGSRGFKWLTYKDDHLKKLGGGIGLYYFEKEKTYLSDLFTEKNFKNYSSFERVFGIGYFKKKVNYNDVNIEHVICSPFSDDPLLVSEYSISDHNDKKSNNKLIIVDFWDVNIHHILKSLIVTWKNRKSFGKSKLLNLAGRLLTLILKTVKRNTENNRRRFTRKFNYFISYELELNTIILTPVYKKKPPVNKDRSCKYDYYPKSLFLAIITQKDVRFFSNKNNLFRGNEICLDWELKEEIRKVRNNNSCLGIGINLNLNENEQERIITLFGYEELDKIANLVKKYKQILSNHSILEWNATLWQNSIIQLEIKDRPQLSREVIWHSYYTRSALFYDEYFKKHRLFQGSVYLFGHGIDGSIRDYALYFNSLLLMDPKIAKEFLLFIISLMLKDGRLPYALYGYGKISSVFVHSKPSDLYLFLLWAIEQYVSLTRDYEFLEEYVSYYDNIYQNESKVREKIVLLINYLFSEKVGFGEHGLIKSNDGDWSDGISLMVNNRRKFIKNGESTFNSSFALYILPKVLDLIQTANNQFVEFCIGKLESLKQAVFKSFNGKWFYRGWDGQGNPIGDQSLYLEHHTWLLISKILDSRKALNLVNEIYNRLDNVSPIGQYISYPPQRTHLNILPQGWDVNGGIWHAINALLTWGYSNYDEEKAFNSLIKNSLAKRAEIYPNIWYGIWSAPDSYIADYAQNAGEAFYHFATPMCDFPIMNLNAHASYLLSVIKLVGIEANIFGIVIDPRISSKEFIFRSPLISLESYLDKLFVSFNGNVNSKYKIKIKKPIWWNERSRIYLNDALYKKSNNLDDEFAQIDIPNNFGPVIIRLIKGNI